MESHFFCSCIHTPSLPSFPPERGWDVADDDNEWLETDELGAYMWGLKVIEKHNERVRKEHGDETEAT